MPKNPASSSVGLPCANAQMCAAEYEQIQQHDYADNAVVRAEAQTVK